MDASLSFASTRMPDDATVEDRIRRSLIELQQTGQSAEDAERVFRGCLDVLSATNTPNATIANLRKVMKRIYKSHPKVGSILLSEMVGGLRTFPVIALCMDFTSMNIENKPEIAVQKEIFDELFRTMLESLMAGGDLVEYMGRRDPYDSFVRTFVVVLHHATPTKAEMEKVVDILSRTELNDDEKMKFVGMLSKLKMGHLMPRDMTVPHSLFHLGTDDEVEIVLESMDARRILRVQELVDDALGKRKSAHSVGVFLRRFAELGLMSLLESSTVSRFFQFLQPRDVTDDKIFGCITCSARFMPSEQFIEKVKDWNVCDALKVMAPKGKLSKKEVYNAVCRIEKTTENYCMIIDRVKQEKALTKLQFWNDLFDVVTEMTDEMAVKFAAKFGSVFGRQTSEAAKNLLKMLKYQENVWKCWAKLQDVKTQSLINKVIDVVESYATPSESLWVCIAKRWEGLLELCGDKTKSKKVVTRKYEILQGLAAIKFSGRGKSTSFQLPDLALLDQTEESVRDIAAFLNRPRSDDMFGVSFPMCREARSVVAAVQLITVAMIRNQHKTPDVANRSGCSLMCVTVLLDVIDRLKSSVNWSGVWNLKEWDDDTFPSEIDLQVGDRSTGELIMPWFAGLVGKWMGATSFFKGKTVITILEGLVNVTNLVDVNCAAPLMSVIVELSNQLVGAGTSQSDAKLKDDALGLVHEFFNRSMVPILEFFFKYGPHVFEKVEGKLNLLVFDRVNVVSFLEEKVRRGVTLEFIIFAMTLAKEVPRVGMENPEAVIPVLDSVIRDESKAGACKCVVNFLIFLKGGDLLLPYEKMDISDGARLLIMSSFRCSGHYDDVSTVKNICDVIVSLSNDPSRWDECQQLIRNVVLDFDARVNQARVFLQTSNNRFSMKIEKAFSSLASLYHMNRKAFCTAVVEIYDTPESVDFMLIEKARPCPIRRSSEFNRELIHCMFNIARNAPSANIFRCMKTIGFFDLNIFGSVRDVINLREMFDLLAESASKMVDVMAISGTMSDEMVRVFDCAAEAMALLTVLLLSPVVMDEIVPYVLEKMQTTVGSILFVYLWILELLTQLETVQLITVALMKRAGWNALVTKLLSSVSNVSVPDRITQICHYQLIILANVFTDIVVCSKAKLRVMAIIKEIQASKSPFTEAFSDRAIAVRTFRDTSQFVFKRFLPDDLYSHVVKASANTFPYPSSGSVHMATVVEDLREAKNGLSIPECDLEIPANISKIALAQLPEHVQSNVLFMTLPPHPENVTPPMMRCLVHQPDWVYQYIREKRTLMVLPEHYMILSPVLTELAGVSETPDALDDDEREVFSREFIEKIVRGALCKRSWYVLESIQCWYTRLLANILMEDNTVRVVIHVIVDLLPEFDAKALKQILNVIASLTDEKCTALFSEVMGENLFKVLPLSKSVDYVKHIIALMRGASPACFDILMHAVMFTVMCTPNFDRTLIRLFCTIPRPNRSSDDIPMFARDMLYKCLENFSQNRKVSGNMVAILIEHYPGMKDEVVHGLIEMLDDILSARQSEELYVAGVLCRILCPPRHESGIAVSSSPLASPPQLDSSVPDQLGIPRRFIEQAPAFWAVIAKNIEGIRKTVAEGGHRVITDFRFILSYPEILPFDLRVKAFSSIQRRKIDTDTLKIRVRRDRLLQDSYHQIRQAGYDKFIHKLSVNFTGEQGIDLGGVRRDWMCAVVRELFNPNYALFIPSSNSMSYQPNPSSGVNPHALEFFEFTGAILARALIEGVSVPAPLTRSLLKHILGLPMNLRDIEDVDDSIYRSLEWVLQNDVTDAELPFATAYDDIGVCKEVALKPDSEGLTVTNENKEEYVTLMVEFRLKSQISRQIEAFCKGFFRIIPQDEIRMFQPDELALVICGVPEIDVDDLERNVTYSGGYRSSTPVVQFFFNVVRGMSAEERAKLLLFITGSSQVPVGGFRVLTERSRAICIAPGGNGSYLPCAHTCMNQIDLPLYKSEQELRTKLLYAILECNSFGIA